MKNLKSKAMTGYAIVLALFFGLIGVGIFVGANPESMVELTINGMRCGGCERNIENGLGEIPGIIRVEIDRKAKYGKISYDRRRIPDSGIIVERIRGMGYDVKCQAFRDLDS